MYHTKNAYNAQELSSLKSLTLTCAIASTVFAVPVLGLILSMSLLPLVALIVIAIITLLKAKKCKLSTTGSILVLCASLCSLITAAIADSAPYLDTHSFSALTYSLIATLFGFCAWGLFIGAAIVLFQEYKKLLLPPTPKPFPHHTTPPTSTSPFQQAPHVQPTQPIPTPPFQQAPQTRPAQQVSTPHPPIIPTVMNTSKPTTPPTQTNIPKSQEPLFSGEIKSETLNHKSHNPFHTPKQTSSDSDSNSLFIQEDLNE